MPSTCDPKKILIVAPYYPPSNLAAVHRARLFAQHLPAFGWEPVILTVHEDYYEEAPDENLERLLPPGQRIEKVSAFPNTRPRLIGDLGLRAFVQIRKRALQLIREESISFVYIPIPSFYLSLIGPYLKRKTRVPFGIDYIDPWVHVFPGSEKWGSRHWFSTKLSRVLEPIAVKTASLITGVAEGYYRGVIERNPHLEKTCKFGAMPYGGEPEDHSAVKRLGLRPYLFRPNSKLQLVYAGAMLPKAFTLLDTIFRSIASKPQEFANVEFHFIGTGTRPTEDGDFTIRPVAEKHGIWESVIFEYPRRIPYLDVLTHLEAADGVFILGSTEPHYTPSKTYQAVLSGKPVFAILHKQSTASQILTSTGAGHVLPFDGESGVSHVAENFRPTFTRFQHFIDNFHPDKVDRSQFDQFSAREVTRTLANLLEGAIS